MPSGAALHAVGMWLAREGADNVNTPSEPVSMPQTPADPQVCFSPLPPWTPHDDDTVPRYDNSEEQHEDRQEEAQSSQIRFPATPQSPPPAPQPPRQTQVVPTKFTWPTQSDKRKSDTSFSDGPAPKKSRAGSINKPARGGPIMAAIPVPNQEETSGPSSGKRRADSAAGQESAPKKSQEGLTTKPAGMNQLEWQMLKRIQKSAAATPKPVDVKAGGFKSFSSIPSDNSHRFANHMGCFVNPLHTGAVGPGTMAPPQMRAFSGPGTMAPPPPPALNMQGAAGGVRVSHDDMPVLAREYQLLSQKFQTAQVEIQRLQFENERLRRALESYHHGGPGPSTRHGGV